MSYTEQNLTPGEVILYRTGLHWVVMLDRMIFGGVFLLVGAVALIVGYTFVGLLIVGFGSLTIALAIVVRNTTEMAVTSRRLIIKAGVLRKNTLELFLPKIESIHVEQGMLGRMLDYGNIVVRGTGGTAEPFKKVRSPLEFRRQVQQQSENGMRLEVTGGSRF